uniref:glucosaminidase domain-containing protein n=1 Tax=Anaerococcus mediterraneensis TaxID=1870984 RepID=UPI0009303A62|nr:glucosaminidase domain-containing protein [Anaerococcus mediterraneensis]
MINKKNKIILAILLLSAIFIKPSETYASENDKDIKESLMNGLRLISEETMNLKDMRDIRFEKFKKDLDEFIEKGSEKIPSKNYFYLLNPTNFTREELGWGLANTNLLGLENDFKEVGEKENINPILLMAMAKHETGNGTSQLFKEKKNLFGFNAIDSDPYNQATDFSSERLSIETVAKHLKNEYLNEKGRYYKGISTKGIGVSYATDPDWSKKVEWMMIEVARNMIKSYDAYEN